MSENSKSPLLLVLIALVCVLIVLQQTGWTLQEQSPVIVETSETKASPESTVQVVDDADAVSMTVKRGDIELLLSALNPQQKQSLLENENAFKQLLTQEAYMRSLLKGAYEGGMDKDGRVQLLIHRARERVLAESYLARLVQKNMQDKLPTEADIEKFYQDNPDKFLVPDRIYISQIYFSYANSSEEEAMEKARKAHQRLVNKKVDFAQLAEEVSEHDSKANGGDMGPVKANEIVAEIQQALDNMKENEISEPIATKSGVHIIKKGGVIKTAKITLEQSRQQIRNLLIQTTRERVKLAIIKRLTETYPVRFETDDPEEWRSSL